MNKDQNAALKARLDAAGYTLDEQVLGTVCAEFKAAMAMQTAGSKGPMGMMAGLALSSVGAKMLALVCKAQAGDKCAELAKRIVEVSDIVSEVCEAQARKDCGMGDEQSQSDDSPAGGARIALESFRRPTEAKDIN